MAGMTVAFDRDVEQATIESESPRRDAQCRCVRVWFGECVICELIAEPTKAAEIEAGMLRRFAGLRVTNELVGGAA